MSASLQNLRSKALELLDHHGTILDIAREISDLLRDAQIPGAVIGGIAVVLHGHVRTTKDVDVLIPSRLDHIAELLVAHGFILDRARREFVRGGIPVHLVSLDQVQQLCEQRVEIEGITTVSLADLIAMKLRSGMADPLRAQDLADVIGLIRHHCLTGKFASRLEQPLRSEFRKLARAIGRERRA